jgi:hypothetical protein
LQTTRVVLKGPTGVSNVHTIKQRAVNVNNDGTAALEADEARPLDHSGSPSLTRFHRWPKSSKTRDGRHGASQ